MEHGKEGPRASPEPPRLNQKREILEELLAIERERLATAVKIERERKIVFPETSVIIHDVLKLVAILYGGEKVTEKRPGIEAGKIRGRGKNRIFE